MKIKEDNNNIIIISIFLLFSIVIYKDLKKTKKKNKGYDHNLNNNNNVIDEYIKTNRICPIKKTITNYTSCIHYPKLNMGFTISTSSKGVLSDIQQSFKNNNNIYKIVYENDKYYFNNNGQNIQEIKICNKYNIDKLINKLGTKKVSE